MTTTAVDPAAPAGGCVLGEMELDALALSVPMLSPSASRLLQVTTDTSHGLNEVIQVVKTDAVLTARLLKVVNSAAFNLVVPIDSVDRAVGYLGERVVVSAALEDSAGALFGKRLDGYAADAGDLWRHSLRTAIAAREIVVRGEAQVSPDVAFTAGLLHDIGKSLISDHLQGSAEELLHAVEAHQVADYREAEAGRIGCDHAQAGHALASAWVLPEVLTQAVRWHHEPARAPQEHQALVYAVHLADHVAMLGGCGTGADTLNYPLDAQYHKHLALSRDHVEAVMADVDEEFTKLASSFES